jgi:hypothetical protein
LGIDVKEARRWEHVPRRDGDGDDIGMLSRHKSIVRGGEPVW